MTDSELSAYITSRHGELSADEILAVTDTSVNKSINHIVYENDTWTMWSESGVKLTFRKRNW